MEEIWKDIPGYEGKYQVSNLGRIRSLDRIDDENHFRKGQIMKTKLLRGYVRVPLRDGKKQKDYQVHRLVALAFIPNPDNLPQVNHKDQDPGNNNVDNLEWCDAKYNINYGDRNEKVSKALSGRKNTWCQKPVLCYNLDGNFVCWFESAHAAGKAINTAPTHITACLRGRYKTAGGFIWKYA